MKRSLLALVCLATAALTSCNSSDSGTPSTTGSSGSGSGDSTSYSLTGGLYMYHNDLQRTGQNLSETILNRTNVAASFGLIGHLPAKGQVYAQPLVANGVVTAGSSAAKNLLYVVTENNFVYAYDITSSQSVAAKTLVWTRDYVSECTQSGLSCRLANAVDINAPNVSPYIGMTATPVIDPDEHTLYYTHLMVENGNYNWYLSAVDLATGQDKTGSPKLVSANYPGTGTGSVNGMIAFNGKTQLSRAGLVLNNGQVTIAFTSFDDNEPCHGWIFTYDTSDLTQIGVWNSTPNTGQGTIWMSGDAPAIDTDGAMFFATGNGEPGAAYNTIADFADSIVKLNLPVVGATVNTAYPPSNHASDFFSPYNHMALAVGDVDVGSGGVLLLPDEVGNATTPHLMIGGGKQGTLYLLNRDHLGGETTNTSYDDNIVGEVVGDPTLKSGTGIPGGKNYGAGLYGTPAYYNHKLITAAAGDVVRSIPINNSQLNPTTNLPYTFIDWANQTYTAYKNPVRGSTPTISASGAATADAIIWIIDTSAFTYSWPYAAGAPPQYLKTTTNGSAILRAYSTDNLSAPLFTSAATSVASPVQTATNPDGSVASQNDDNCVSLAGGAAGCAVKFAVPTVQNGMVFVGTDTEVTVFGLQN